MKFLITEDKRERLVDKQLSDEYDGLIRFVGSNRPDLIFFITNTGKNMVEKDNIFYYNKFNFKKVYYMMWWFKINKKDLYYESFT